MTMTWKQMEPIFLAILIQCESEFGGEGGLSLKATDATYSSHVDIPK